MKSPKMQQPKRNAESIGISLSVIIAWVLAQFSGIDIPPEVTAAMSGLITGIAVRLKDDYEKPIEKPVEKSDKDG